MNKKHSSFSLKTMLTASISLILLSGGCSTNQVETKSVNKKPVMVKGAPLAIPIAEMKKMNKQQQILSARQGLASRLKLKLDEVALSGVTPVMWRSGALGCPKAGMQYTQALVRGVLIMLRVGNAAYRYHATPAGEPFYCPDTQAESPYMNSSDT